MSETVRLWESAQGKDIGQLKKHVVWSGDAVGFRANDGHFRIALGPTHARLFRTGDLSGPARHLVQKLVNEKKLAGDVSAKLLWTDRPPRLGLHVCPASLLGALWLQFAQFLSEGREHRRYKFCGNCLRSAWRPRRPQSSTATTRVE